MPKFVHLHTHSHYSLLDGLAKIDELVRKAKELNMDALALTDHGYLYGAVEFYKKAKKAGIKPILGVEAYIAPGSRHSREPGERYSHLILLAKNDVGWKNLVQLTTKACLEGFYYKPRMDKEILREHSEGLIALSACISGEIPKLLLAGRFEDAEHTAREYENIFGSKNFYLEIGDHPNIPETVSARKELIKLSRATGIPLAATQDIHYLNADDSEYHDILLAVQTGNKLTDDDRLTLKADNFSMTSPEEMAAKFADIPDAVTNTGRIADMCSVTLPLGAIHLPHFPKPEGISANDYLRTLVTKRSGERFPRDSMTPDVEKRIHYELGVIEKTGFADYFLIVQDLIVWAKDHGIAVGPGRGSAAGSIISYILGITDINPLAYNLLFERFLNPDRNEMPDIDIDFADTRRDEVLAYAIDKYGEDCVAQIITFGTMAARAAIRDAGRAMGLSYGFCDKIAKLIPFNMKLAEARESIPELRELAHTDADARKLLDAASHLEGVARHASVHACGTVIASKPLTNYVPLQRAPQSKTSIVTQFEMHSIEDLGLLKIDFLGLKNLTIIEDTVRLVKDLRGETISLSDLPLNDKKTFALLQAGSTTGVFQFESNGMRRYMKILKPTELEDLIALVALFRPGPMELIPSFINRKHGKETIAYLHPRLEPILKNTYGIGVYQEQMMQIARDLAGYTLPEADTLRKAIGKKIKSLLDEQKEKLIDGMVARGIDKKTAEAIWELFPPFARYGFNKSHAACYATIAYRTAYLKAHYQVEFTASLLNAEMRDIERIAYLIGEARLSKIDVLPPDINKSFVNFTPEGDHIRFGLLAIKNVGEQITREIIAERAEKGPFADLADFLTRIQHKDLNKKSLESLIKAGALDSLGIIRAQCLGNIDEILKFSSALRRENSGNGQSLFGANHRPRMNLSLAAVKSVNPPDTLAWEKEVLGFYISDHPLNRYTETLKKYNSRSIEEVRRIKDEQSTFRVGGLVSKIQRITTKRGEPMIFATLEDLTPRSMEIIVFNSTFAKTVEAWQENNVLIVQGRMSWRDGEPKMICEAVKHLQPI